MPDFPQRSPDPPPPLFAQPVAAGVPAGRAPRRDRMRSQMVRIVELFRGQREVSNRQLAAIALKYTGRMSDLRKLGYKFEITRRDMHTGECWYTMTAEAPEPLRIV